MAPLRRKNRRHNFSKSVGALAVAALFVGVAPIATAYDGDPIVGKTVSVGPITITVPKNWKRREGPAADNPHYDAPGKNPGFGPSVAIAIEDNQPETNQNPEGLIILDRERRTIAGRPATIRHWRSEEGDSEGVTLEMRDFIPGKTILTMGWTLQKDWSKRKAEIWRILDSISLRDPAQIAQTAAQAPQTAQKPQPPNPQNPQNPQKSSAQNSGAPIDLTPKEPQNLGALQSVKIENVAAVVSKPRAPSIITIRQPILARVLRTYHWNDGKGDPPGEIALIAADGRRLGPWRARGESGQGGAPNVSWVAAVNQRLEPGKYVVEDSNPQTWSTNEGARWRGFYSLDYQPFLEDVAQSDLAQKPQTAAPQPEAAGPKADPAAPQSEAAAPNNQIFGPALRNGLGSWDELSGAGGDFKKFARLTPDGLIIDVPENSGWGKTGIKSKAAILKFDPKTPTQETLSFRLIPEKTSSFVITFSTRKDGEEWGVHDARLAWSGAADGASSTLTLWIGGAVAGKAELGPRAPEQLDVSAAANGLFRAQTPDGARVEGVLPQAALESGLYVWILTHAPGENKPAALGLRDIARIQGPLARPIIAPAYAGREDLLADGPAPQFLSHATQGGDFGKHARLSKDGLTVDAPRDSGWGKVGLRSPEPLFWLDGWGPGASADLTFRFDSQNTDGFVIALSAPSASPGSEPVNPALLYHWRRQAKGGARAALALSPQTWAPVFDVQLLEQAPQETRISLTPEGVRIIADGLPNAAYPWEGIRAGQGFRVWAYSHPDAPNMPVKMALRGISLERVFAPEAAAEAAAPETDFTPGAPLPIKILFAGAQSRDWEPIGVAGGDFAKFAKWENNALAINAPENNAWAKTGLLSASPVVALDARQYKTPYRLSVAVDPKRASGFAVAIGPEKKPDMFAVDRVAISLIAQPDGDYLLSLDRSRYHAWARKIAKNFIEAEWDGRLLIDLGPQWTEIRLGETGPMMRAPTGFEPPAELYMSIQSHPARENQAARLALLGVSGQWLTPPGMSAAARWEFLDDADFNPQSFIEDLGPSPARSAQAQISPAASDKPPAPSAPAGLSAQDAEKYLDAPILLHPPKKPEPEKPKSGWLDNLSPISSAHAQEQKPDCAKPIGDYIDQARRIEITLGEQADVAGQLTNLGLTLLGKAKFEDGTLREKLRANADKIVNAWQDGQAIGDDWKEERTQDMVSHFMQAALKIGLTSDALADDRTFRDARRALRDTWANALKNLPEDRARALIADMSRTIQAATPNHDLYKELLDKGRDIDFGAAFGQGAQGEGKAMLWTLTNTTLSAFSPHYAIGKELAATLYETAKAAKAFAVNESVRQMYGVWKEEIAKNGGAEAKAFYDARTTIGSSLPLNEAKALMRAGKGKAADAPIDDAAAEAFLFRQFESWFKADQAAAKQADGLAKANSAFNGLKCRDALRREVAPTGNACAQELQMFKRYADLQAQTRGRINSWMQQGNQCNNPAAIDGQADFLVCHLLDYGEDAYKTALGKYLEGCGLMNYAQDRNSAAERAAARLPSLNATKLKAVFDRAGVTASGDFYSCLCADFHYYDGPDAKGPCRRIGPLGGVTWSGFRARDWGYCAKTYRLKDGRSVIDAVADTLSGIHIDQK